MSILILVLRIIHVSAAIFWGGGTLIMDFFIGPTIGATQQAGQQFAGHLVLKTRFISAMTASAVLTVLAGAGLYWIDSQGLTSGWMKSGAGIGFTIGALFGLVAFVFGAIFGQLNKKMATIGSQIQGQPTPEQLNQIQAVRKQLATVTPIHLVAIIAAISMMGASRYLHF